MSPRLHGTSNIKRVLVTMNFAQLNQFQAPSSRADVELNLRVTATLTVLA